MIEAARSSAALILGGVAARPEVWFCILFVAAIGSAPLALLNAPHLRRGTLILWAVLPPLATGLWLVWCNARAASTGWGDRCFAQGFAFALGLMVVPVWAAGTLIGAVVMRRLRGG